MTTHVKALTWAAFILGAAAYANANGVSDGAIFGIIAGLTGAALGTVLSGEPCTRGCLPRCARERAR